MKLWRSSAGKVLRNGTKVIRCDECPCADEPPGDPCFRCSDEVPATLYLNVPAGFSGTCDTPWTGNFALAQTADGCFWEYVFPGSSYSWSVFLTSPTGSTIVMRAQLARPIIGLCSIALQFELTLGPAPTAVCFDSPKVLPVSLVNASCCTALGGCCTFPLTYSGASATVSA